MGSKATERSKRYHDKAGYTTKGFRMYKDLGEMFAMVCNEIGVTQAEVITTFMKQFIADHGYKYEHKPVADDGKTE